jgi:class 3 adenylate cyclase
MAEGYATLGRIGFEDRFDYTAIGAVINLAARLCADAGDGQILVSGRLAVSMADVVEVDDFGDRPLRGMSRPIAVVNLRALRS